jgi:hypothetical protein
MKRSLRLQLALCALAASAFTFAPSASAQNLIVNGGFEDGFASWTLTPGTFSFAGNDPMFAHQGNGFANLEATGFVASLSQSFNTVVGQTYSISFFLANDVPIQPFSFSATFGPTGGSTAPQYTLTNTGMFGYTRISFDAVASSTNSTLRFDFRHDEDFFRLDTVSVVPEPSTNVLMILSGAGLLGFVQYRRVKARRALAEA